MFLVLEDVWETDVSRMWVCKAKGSRSVKCFIQVHFTFLFQRRTAARVLGTAQFSSVKQERRHCTMRCGSQGSLLLVKETGPTRCCEDANSHGFLLFGRPRL